MTPLLNAVLEKVKSSTSVNKKYFSPPPESEELEVVAKKTWKKYIDKFAHVRPKVDTSAPQYDLALKTRNLPIYRNQILNINRENMQLLMAIKQAHFNRGKVDCRWKKYPHKTLVYYSNRVNFYNQVNRDNLKFYHEILKKGPEVVPTSKLRRDWASNRRKIIEKAQGKFVLFPPVPSEVLEDEAFATPPGVTRPRVYISLRIHGCAEMGALAAELFPDVCPETCRLFLALATGDGLGFGYIGTCFFRVYVSLGMGGCGAMGALAAELFPDVCPETCRLFLALATGDGLGFGYIGTCFFRKVPGLYWTGGDVTHDNGFGCYAQCGRRVPIGAENYHFSHSMPGLLSMRVTKDDEMCGIFNITFKPLPQFDLRSVVFGRIIRPCKTYDCISQLGHPLSTWPIVEVSSTRRRLGDGWVTGAPNTRVVDVFKLHKKRYV